MECRVWSVKYGVESVECEVWSGECRVWSVKYGVGSVECGVYQKYQCVVTYLPREG